SPSRQARTASAFRRSGTTQRISRDLRIWRTDIEIAVAGTSSRRVNHPAARASRRRVRRLSLDEMEGPRVDPGDDALLEVAPEARGVGLGEAHILVEVEELDPAPVDAVGRGEGVQELELRGPGGRDRA